MLVVILTRFYEGGASLILVWFLFAILGLPLILAYVSIGQKLENKFYFIRWATTLGVISGIVQIIGLLVDICSADVSEQFCNGSK